MTDSEISIPSRFFDRLIHGFVRDEGFDLAQSFKEGGLAVPGVGFGDFFAWAWEEDSDIAMKLLAQLLDAANEHTEYEEITLRKLLDDMQYALHRTKYARDDEYTAIRTRAASDVPPLLEGSPEE